VERSTPRTLLEQLIQHSDRSLEEHCRDFDARARQMGEPAGLSVRQLGRWMAGDVSSARPASRRVAKRLWGRDFAVLVRPPTASVAVAPATSPILRRSDFYDREQARSPLARSLYEEIVMTAEESARFVRYSGTELTSTVIEQLESDVRQFAVEYYRQPPYALFRPLATVRREVFTIIDRHPRPEYLSDLYRVAGQLSALLTLTSNDLSQPYAADSHARTAWMCADLAGDTSLRAYLRWLQSHLAYWQGDYRLAAELAGAGQEYATTSSDRLRLASQQARALAAAGQTEGIDRALAVATDAGQHIAQEPKAPGIFHFTPGKAAYYASEVHLALGGTANCRQAVLKAHEAVRWFDTAPPVEQSPELRAVARLDLVAAHLALGDLDAGHAHGRTVLALPAEHRTMQIINRMKKIAIALADARFSGARLADELSEQITVFCAYPAARELPDLPG
jgi:hypothetical protein